MDGRIDIYTTQPMITLRFKVGVSELQAASIAAICSLDSSVSALLRICMGYNKQSCHQRMNEQRERKARPSGDSALEKGLGVILTSKSFSTYFSWASSLDVPSTLFQASLCTHKTTSRNEQGGR